MATPSNATRPIRRKSSTTNLVNKQDTELTTSLSQLSISTPPGGKSSSSLKEPNSRRSSPSPHRPLSSRSPSLHRRDSDAGGRTLLRKASTNSLHSASGVAPPSIPARRSSSTQIVSPSPSSSFGIAAPIPEKPALTAASVANKHFETELQTHHGETPSRETKTVVILNDAVYGHRFSRPRTSRNALSTIVERPERIRAGVLGVSMAYVRLGERHAEGAFPIHPKMNVSGLGRIPFRIQKTTRRLPLTSPAVTNVHGCKWMEELTYMCNAAESKLAMGGKELQRPDMNRGPDQPPPERLHEGDLYLCSESLDAMEGALGAVCEAVDTVFGSGPRQAFVGVRPPGHHCSASHPSGFCWVNNVHVGIMHAAMTHNLTHAAIIDFDLHHGDGSQAITWEHNSRAMAASRNAAAWKRTSIGYFSLHDINSYPCEMGDFEKVRNASVCIDNAHGQNIWNVHLHSWKTEQDFWNLYENKYIVLLEKTRDYLKAQSERVKAAGQAPKAAIFFSAGFDASEWESAGMQRHQVNVPTEFYARLSEDVVAIAAEEGLCVDGRVISVLEGGYSDRALCSGIFSHLSGLVGSRQPKAPSQLPPSHSVQSTIFVGGSDMIGDDSTYRYNPAWWSHAELESLESLMTRPPTPPKKPRQVTPSTYSSPTQASTAKAVDSLRVRRSLSNLNAHATPVRPPSPPPPEVPWTIAAHELSKVLIPNNRQTGSCQPEDLNAEASRARRDRQSALMGITPTAPPPTPDRPTPRTGLRDRKAKLVIPITEEAGEQPPKSRRKAPPSAPSSPIKQSGIPTANGGGARRTSRRLSGVSPVFSPVKDGRPQSAHAEVARPSSALSSGTQGSDKLPVKKTRPAAPRTTSRSGKKPPVSASKARSTKASKLNQETPTPSPGPGTRMCPAGGEVDKITSGMKKIRINLITQSQKEKNASAATTPAEEGSVSSFAGDQQLPSPSTEGQGSLPSSSHSNVYETPQFASQGGLAPQSTAFSSSGLSTPVLEHEPTTPEPYQVALPDSAPETPLMGGVQPGDASDVFIPYQPEGPTPMALRQQEPLKWLPPNADPGPPGTPATPNPVKKQSSLFRHTPGTSIPFAPRPAELKTPKAKSSSSPKKNVKEENKFEPKDGPSLWDIPETPQH